MIKKFVEELRKALETPLPGTEAHRKLAPLVKSESKDFFVAGENARKGGVLILLFEDRNGNIRFPLIERSIYDGAHSGQISLPGGKVEEGETFIETALRETEEEIGFSIGSMQVVGLLSKIYVMVSNFVVQPVLAYTTASPVFTPEPHEVEKIIEARLADLVNVEKLKTKKIKAALGSVVSPYFDLEGSVVWGATAMILSEFVEIISRSEGLKNSLTLV